MMDTPICDFIRDYNESKVVRFHMPGHKGVPFLGCEPLDLTEISGADSLYEADGIIARSEANAAALFGTARTAYSTEGASQCIRAMLCLALMNRRPGTAPVLVAARNVHKAFVYAAALLDAQVVWLWPEEENRTLCGCRITPQTLEKTLEGLKEPPAAVYLTSPDYLGNLADIRALAQVCHAHGTLLAVDNAHGAYLHFLETPCHPLDLGADLCCDSAHKTLPVLTGGAYLHLAKSAPEAMAAQIKTALEIFGSTSPSYLTLTSLDRCNRYLSEDYPGMLEQTVSGLERIRNILRSRGWEVPETDPLRIRIAAPAGSSGMELAARLRAARMECEYADPEFVVLMLTPETRLEDLEAMTRVLGENTSPRAQAVSLPAAEGEQVMSIRQALFAPHEVVPVEKALGRICGAPTVSCPPAVPIAVSGERIGPAELELFRHYGVASVDVIR